MSLALSCIETNYSVLLKEEVNVVKVMYKIITYIYLLTASIGYFLFTLVIMHNKNPLTSKIYHHHQICIYCYFGLKKPQEVEKYVTVLYPLIDLKYSNYWKRYQKAKSAFQCHEECSICQTSPGAGWWIHTHGDRHYIQ